MENNSIMDLAMRFLNVISLALTLLIVINLVVMKSLEACEQEEDRPSLSM